MKLIFIAERYPPDLGGVATSAGRISHALAGLGAQVDVIAWTRTLQSGIVEEEHVADDLRVFRMGRFREWDSTLPHTMNLVDWLTSTMNYDAVWGHYLAPAGFAAAWIGKRKGIASTVSIRGNDLDRDMFPPGDFARLEWTLRHASIITAVTTELAAKVHALTGRKDVVYLRNSVDAAVFQPCAVPPELRPRLGIREGEAVLGFAGELREKKGLQFLLQALREVREKRPACLLVIGEVRPSEVVRVMQALGPGTLEDNRVLVTGQLATPAEVNQHLQLCDVYLQPSLWDGMPNALLEAMAAGCGCIGSDAGGIPEIIESEKSGLIVPRWKLNRLSKAILGWLNTPEGTRQRMRVVARDRVASEFTFAREREDLAALMQALHRHG